MTGQGQGRKQYGAAEITAEVRAVNNRHLKVQTRTSEGLAGLEPQIETLVRNNLRRGSLQLGVQVIGGGYGSNYQLQEAVLSTYLKQSQEISEKLGIDSQVSLRDLLSLPGVVMESRTTDGDLPQELVTCVLETVSESLDCLNRMRRVEGNSMAEELTQQLDRLVDLATEIEKRAPVVLEEYRIRLESRVSKLLSDLGAKLQEADLLREVLLMADKTDIREEIVRLRSHVTQFRNLLGAPESQGRKLDFLIQEMFRETNTIGSKSGDAEIAQRVVDIKTIIEQMRELVQNVE